MTLQYAGPSTPALPHIAFLKRPKVQKVLPLATSLAFHISIVVIALMTYRAVKVVYHSEEQVQTNFPISCGPVDWHPLPHPTPPDSIFNRTPTDLPTANNDFAGQNQSLHSFVSTGTIESPGEASLFIGPATSHRGIQRIHNAASGDYDAGFGPVRGTAVYTCFAPAVGSPARSVAFVCDASGSMTATFDPLKHEIKRFVDALRPNQSFNVIFFQESAAASVDSHSLLMAKPDSKRQAYTFLDGVSPRGQTDPLPALDLAFKQKPGLIYLLTDGDFPDNAAVLKFIRAKNTDGRTRINTIAFVARGDGYEKVLQTIAHENGGVFRYVSESDLER